MYAVLEDKGRQYIVKEGDRLSIGTLYKLVISHTLFG